MSERLSHSGRSLRSADEGGLVLLRLVLATVFIAHRSQKLFGGFGGGGLSGTARFMAAHGLTPGFLFAVLGGLAEFVGGILIAALLAVAAAPGRVSLDHLLHARGHATAPASASVEAVPPHTG
jgi:uncharacterized membrane protein YphA (DoxX/SURF4 family)